MRLSLWIMLGGALGSAARFLVSRWAANHFGSTCPWGILVVNVPGSFVIGFFASQMKGP